MDVPLWVWFAFVGGVVALLGVDLAAHRKAHVIEYREAVLWSLLWVSLGIGFAFVIWAWQGPTAAGEYTAAWLLEKSLSVDNLFVFALIFGYFKVPREYQHRVLFYGVLGALVLRFIFIAAGVALLSNFSWVIYIFGGFLLYTAFKMLKDSGVDMDPGKSRAVKLVRKLIPVTDDYHGQHFVLRRAGKLVATPLVIVLVAVETADVLFAFDSVPAALAVTDKTFLVYSANAFAILGLRSLFFLLSGLLARFHRLGTGLAFILAFIGVKMIISEWYHMPIGISLGVIGVVLAASIVWSMLTEPDGDDAPEQDAPDQDAHDQDAAELAAGNGGGDRPSTAAVTVGAPAPAAPASRTGDPASSKGEELIR